jgi:MarR family transcriptional regulator, organic hydroperoxide resistance regulator
MANDRTASRPADRAIDHLAFVSGYLYRLLRYAARDLGIRWTALMVLKDLALLGPSTQRTLAEIEQVREPTMTVLLQQMQKRGWVTRRRSPDSGRVKLAAITPKGEGELATAGRFLRERLRTELAGLSAAEWTAIDAGLGPLVEHLTSKIGEAMRPHHVRWKEAP